ncbi:hypothetical protein EG328_006023 [Venturia inaequalis]|uniref:Uncharacterized protein n=1 Tax=Venturia inaequalis TaxID=5025 RepID=A0A8H3ZAF9_VENIN|nr:hypothetical protein EG328_006023 [Venturia inaequalis]
MSFVCDEVHEEIHFVVEFFATRLRTEAIRISWWERERTAEIVPSTLSFGSVDIRFKHLSYWAELNGCQTSNRWFSGIGRILWRLAPIVLGHEVKKQTTAKILKPDRRKLALRTHFGTSL